MYLLIISVPKLLQSIFLNEKKYHTELEGEYRYYWWLYLANAIPVIIGISLFYIGVESSKNYGLNISEIIACLLGISLITFSIYTSIMIYRAKVIIKEDFIIYFDGFKQKCNFNVKEITSIEAVYGNIIIEKFDGTKHIIPMYFKNIRQLFSILKDHNSNYFG